ncbi:DNA polymerase III subunit psi [Thalassotalea sp. PLHSN55]|uniref:DNA polymerase III subunit psi n=1 Tax=Thalassotalea sp. PLHSN55 TaxID=3435888 RepID=UPI003F824895
MPLSTRQFDYLTEMGINLWCSKAKLDNTSETQTPCENIHFDEVSQLTLFSDILICLNLSIGEVTYSEQQLNLGLFNWQFGKDNGINFNNNLLTTPSLNTLQKSPKLKQQLWQIFCEHNLYSNH